MAENLAYLPSVNAKSDSSFSVAKYYVYNYDGADTSMAKASSNYTTYGVLYNWPAAMGEAASSSASPSGVQGACPSGWHLPSDTEWQTLVDSVGGWTGAGQKLKSQTGWKVYSGITNEDVYAFSSLPSGGYYGLAFSYIGVIGYWWSATQYDATHAYSRFMDNSSDIVRNNGNFYAYGFAVRCIED